MDRQHQRQVPIREKVIFAMGDFFGGGGQTILAVLYLIFLTNVVGIQPAWAGTVVMISKIWDAISDPLMGTLSDHTRSRFGRRRPYIFAGGWLIIAAMALLWNPIRLDSETAMIIYVTASYLFYSTVSTVIAVPYSSLSTELSTVYEETNRINLMRLLFSLVSTAICTLLPTYLFDQLVNGSLSMNAFYMTIVLGFGLFFALPLILIGIFAKERVPLPKQKSTFHLKEFIRPLQVRSFRRLLALYLCQSINLDVVSAIILYFSLYVIQGLDATIFLASFLVVQLIMIPIINGFVNKVSKTKIYRMGLPLAILCAGVIAFYPADAPAVGAYIAAGLMAVGFAGAQTMSWIIFPDVVDIAHLGMGDRISGAMSGAMTLIRKAASAVAIFVIGLVLDVSGFIRPTDAMPEPVQPDGTIMGLRLVFFLSWLLLMGAAFFIARRFAISPQVSKRIQYFLSVREEKGIDQLNVQEQKEYEDLLRDFV